MINDGQVSSIQLFIIAELTIALLHKKAEIYNLGTLIKMKKRLPDVVSIERA